MNEKVQSLKDWFPILDWTELPNFAGCQNLDYDKFIKIYYVDEQLQSTLDSFITHLDSDYSNKTDARFIGNPGSGKTTFLYWILKLAKSGLNKALNRYVFHIFHVNRANSEDYKEQIRIEIQRAWEELYISCNKEDIYRQYSLQSRVSTKTIINKLSTHYRKNRFEFDKLLVFILDDIDMLSNEMAFNVLSTVKSNLELIQAMIWVSIRSETIEKYDHQTKKLLLEMFSKATPLDFIPLSAIVKKRVQAVSNGSAKNPFSTELCDQMLHRLFKDNKRLSLTVLEAVLEDNLPGNFGISTSEAVLQNYLDKGVIHTFLKHEHIPNIHLRSLRTMHQYPLAYDIIGCLAYTSNRNILLGTINQIAITRSRSSSIRGRIFKINLSDLKSTLSKLENEKLIDQSGNEILLTNIGQILSERITNINTCDYYNDVCKGRFPSHEVDELYWELLRPSINYKNEVETMITWNDLHAQGS